MCNIYTVHEHTVSFKLHLSVAKATCNAAVATYTEQHSMQFACSKYAIALLGNCNLETVLLSLAKRDICMQQLTAH